MTITYRHSEDPTENPAPLGYDAISAVARALSMSALKEGGPFTRDADVMGFIMRPSPELHGAGAGVLDVDYSDGRTFTFDVSAGGRIEQRRFAYAYAVVVERDEPLDDDEACEPLPDLIEGREFCSGAAAIPYTPGNYGVMPVVEKLA